MKRACRILYAAVAALLCYALVYGYAKAVLQDSFEAVLLHDDSPWHASGSLPERQPAESAGTEGGSGAVRPTVFESISDEPRINADTGAVRHVDIGSGELKVTQDGNDVRKIGAVVTNGEVNITKGSRDVEQIDISGEPDFTKESSAMWKADVGSTTAELGSTDGGNVWRQVHVSSNNSSGIEINISSARGAMTPKPFRSSLLSYADYQSLVLETLPTFQTVDELRRDTFWSTYLNNVYGASTENESLFPVNVSSFHMLYGDTGGPDLIARLENLSVNTRLGERQYNFLDFEADLACPSRIGQIFRCHSWYRRYGSCYLELPSDIFIFQGSPPRLGLPNHTWVEVSHYNLKFELPGGGAWFFLRPGSGMWLNLGHTRVYEEHWQGVLDIFNQSNVKYCEPRHPNCGYYFRKLAKLSREQGIDSIQFTRHADMRCGNTAMEIMFMHSDGNLGCESGNWSRYLRAGLQASCRCDCFETPDSLFDTSKKVRAWENTSALRCDAACD